MAEKPSGTRKNLNQVEVNAQWEEAVRKEMKGIVLNEKFDFNPKNLLLISDKPTSVNKMGASAAANTSEEMSALSKKLEVLTAVPKNKYPYPMTASQEIGWENDTMFDVHRPKYGFNRNSYNETKFANVYVTTFHKSPFASNKPEVDIGKK